MNREIFIEYINELGIAGIIIFGQIIAITVIWQIFRLIGKRVSANAGHQVKALVINKVHILSSRQIIRIVLFLLRIAKYLVTAFLLFITVPIVFSLFPQTEELAEAIFGYILNPLRIIGLGALNYLPNLFTIIIILLITKYILRGLNFFYKQIEKGRLKVPGFYPEWAHPTFNILRFVIYAFNVAVIYPYLPGSESRIFQGVSVFVGIIISISSSTAIGNLVAGLVLTYMRSFKVGDRIKILDNTGYVVEKNLMVLRIKTTKNEYITIPNLQVLSANIINYNTSSDEDEEGLILHAEITFNYATPWRLIHEILIEAASKTIHVLENPKPYVLQTALDDNYARYQINCYTKEIAKISAIYSDLYQNLQDAFASHGIDMTAPEYRITLPPESRGEGPWVKG